MNYLFDKLIIPLGTIMDNTKCLIDKFSEHIRNGYSVGKDYSYYEHKYSNKNNFQHSNNPNIISISSIDNDCNKLKYNFNITDNYYDSDSNLYDEILDDNKTTDYIWDDEQPNQELQKTTSTKKTNTSEFILHIYIYF